VNKYPDMADAKAVLATLAKLGCTEFKRSDIRFAATGHPKPKYSGGLGYVTPVAQQLLDLNWIERTARDRYRITKRGWQITRARGPAIGGQAAYQRRGAADCGEYRETYHRGFILASRY